MSYVHLLKNVSLFAQITEDELADLTSDLTVQTLHKNQMLFQQNSTTSSLYIVKNGSIQIKSFGREGELIYVGIYGPEQCFGEYSVLDGLPRSGEAIALTNTELLVLTRPAFFRYLERRPTVAIKLLVTASRRLRFAEATVDHPVPMQPREKIVRVLLNVSERYGKPDDSHSGTVQFSLRLTGDDLASLAGVTRDVANAVVTQLEHSKLLQLERSHIVVAETNGLRMLLGTPASAS